MGRRPLTAARTWGTDPRRAGSHSATSGGVAGRRGGTPPRSQGRLNELGQPWEQGGGGGWGRASWGRAGWGERWGLRRHTNKSPHQCTERPRTHHLWSASTLLMNSSCPSCPMLAQTLPPDRTPSVKTEVQSSHPVAGLSEPLRAEHGAAHRRLRAPPEPISGAQAPPCGRLVPSHRHKIAATANVKGSSSSRQKSLHDDCDTHFQ